MRTEKLIRSLPGDLVRVVRDSVTGETWVYNRAGALLGHAASYSI